MQRETIDDREFVLDPKCALKFGTDCSLTDFRGYRVGETWCSWMVGNGDQFGDYSFGTDYYQHAGKRLWFGARLCMHFLAGPDRTDMPPRLYNFLGGYQKRDVLGEFAYDVAAGVNAASDFAGSSRRGIRFPAHAVGYLKLEENFDLVFGADFLDRADIHWLPVAGFVWCPSPDVRIEVVFPYPRVDFQVTDDHRLYLAGGVGGGTWAVERDSEVDDLATYGDLRAAIGLENLNHAVYGQVWEIAVLFDRQLQYTSLVGDYRPDATVMIRSLNRY